MTVSIENASSVEKVALFRRLTHEELERISQPEYERADAETKEYFRRRFAQRCAAEKPTPQKS